MTIVKRVAHTTLLPKLLWAALLVLGLSERSTALIMLFVVSAWCIRIYVKGVREQYWEPLSEGHARRWEDLVWDHSVWVNPDETPEQAVERLAGPWRSKQCLPSATPIVKSAPTVRRLMSRVTSSVVGAPNVASRNTTAASLSAPHLLPIPKRFKR